MLVVLFTRQMAVLFRSGVPLVMGLEALAQNEDPKFARVVETLSQLVATGHTFSQALAHFPRIFNRVYITMIGVGVNTGQLASSLETLADWLERDNAWRQKMRGAIAYPIFIVVLTFGMAAMLFHSVMPGFLEVFTDLKLELPLATRVLVKITEAVSNPGFWVLLFGVTGFTILTIRDYARTERGGLALFRALLLVPGLGRVVQTATLARYSCALGSLLTGGAGLLQSLKMAAHASNNPLILSQSKTLVNAVSEGESMSDFMLARPHIYPPTMAQLAGVGEESARLGEMYLKVADYYASEVEHFVEAMSAALEPVLLALVASIVGFIVLAIFLPLYSNLGSLGA